MAIAARSRMSTCLRWSVQFLYMDITVISLAVLQIPYSQRVDLS